MRRLALLLAAVTIAACTSFGPREADRYFVLEARPASGASPHALAGHGVNVPPTTAAGFYDTQSMAFSREAGTRAYYQFNHWAERPQRVIHAQLASRLQGDDPRNRFVLRTHLDEIYHDAVVPPGTARIAISAELVDAATRAVVARRRFTRSAPAASYDAAGAVQGFNQAFGEVIDDIVEWVTAQPM